jgi:hypothetical protein
MSTATPNDCAPVGRGARGLGHQAPELASRPADDSPSATDEGLVAGIDPQVWDREQSLALDRLILRREAEAERAPDGGAP